jgi:hypothetical protein
VFEEIPEVWGILEYRNDGVLKDHESEAPVSMKSRIPMLAHVAVIPAQRQQMPEEKR